MLNYVQKKIGCKNQILMCYFILTDYEIFQQLFISNRNEFLSFLSEIAFIVWNISISECHVMVSQLKVDGLVQILKFSEPVFHQFHFLH